MKTTRRFDQAVTKLYNAFNEGRLNAGDCRHCAVGNLCDNVGDWQHFFYAQHGKGVIDYPDDPFALIAISKTGYSPLEIVTIEKVFVDTIGRDELQLIKKGNTEEQFNGLIAVITYLSKLDGIKVPKITIEKFESVLTK